MTLEKRIERAAVAAARAMGVESVKFKPPGSDGWPDRLFWIPGGRPLLIEFKRPGETLEPLQAERHRFLKGLGYEVATCWSVEGAVARIELAVGR